MKSWLTMSTIFNELLGEGYCCYDVYRFENMKSINQLINQSNNNYYRTSNSSEELSSEAHTTNSQPLSFSGALLSLNKLVQAQT